MEGLEIDKRWLDMFCFEAVVKYQGDVVLLTLGTSDNIENVITQAENDAFACLQDNPKTQHKLHDKCKYNVEITITRTMDSVDDKFFVGKYMFNGSNLSLVESQKTEYILKLENGRCVKVISGTTIKH